GVEKNILPGMTSQIDIKIGKRKVIDFFISPIKKAKNGLKVR
ncbi:MAG: secretion protein HlyD, partial [Clostridiales bacterium]|nr:secretion protein HlyD [Clostridiales bacterium]